VHVFKAENVLGPISFPLELGEAESVLYVGHYLAYVTSPVWQMTMNIEQSVEWELLTEAEVLREILPQCHFVHHKSHMTCDRTRAAAVESWRLTSWATARPSRPLGGMVIIRLFWNMNYDESSWSCLCCNLSVRSVWQDTLYRGLEELDTSVLIWINRLATRESQQGRNTQQGRGRKEILARICLCVCVCVCVCTCVPQFLYS
jgi:hypothetical protein